MEFVRLAKRGIVTFDRGNGVAGALMTSFERNPVTASAKPANDKQIYDVVVFAPRSPSPKEFHWDKHMRISDAAAEAATSFGYEDGTPALALEDVVLDSSLQLHQTSIRDGARLNLIDNGGGV